MTLVDRYVRGRMSSTEKSGFEGNYLVTPERRAKVAEARVFHNELDKLRPVVVPQAQTVGWLEKIFGGFGFSIPALQYAAAVALVVFGLSTAWLLYDGW